MSNHKKPRTKQSSYNVKSQYPVGRGSAVKPAEAATITGLSLMGMSGTEIARRLKRSKAVVSRILNSSDAQHARALARSILLEHSADFSRSWVIASKVAAAKGRHEASRDALLAIGAIEEKSKKPDAPGFTVKIGVMLPGLGPSATALDIDAGPQPVVEEDTTDADAE